MNDYSVGKLARFAFSSALIAPLALASGAAAAADTQSVNDAQPLTQTDAQIEEIVVTAQRKSESLQKSAITVSVLKPEDLANSGATTPQLLTSALPTVQVGSSGPASAVYIRGVGGFAATASTSPAVPYYIDGVYVDRTQSVVSETYDISRLELVKGPQGTLYGRNASGGAINYITTRPKLGEYEVSGSFEGGNYSDKGGEFAVNVPFGETIAARLSGTVEDKDGYTSEHFGGDKHAAGRLKVLFQPSDDFSVLVNTSYGEIDNDATAGVVPLNRNIQGWYPWLDITDPRTQAFVASTAVVPVPGFVRAAVPSDAYQELKFYNASAEVNWDVGFGTVTVIPAYRHASMQYADPVGFLVDNGSNVGSIPPHPLTSNYTSLEARLGGTVDRLQYVGGIFYDNETQAEQYTVDGGYLQSVGEVDTVGARSYAAFGQATFEVIDHVRLIGGLRYTADRRELLNGTSYIISPAAFLGAPPPQAVACALPAPTQPQCVVDTFAGSKTFTNVSFKAGLEADVLDNSLAYGTVSRGFKAGGFNEQSALGAPGDALPFQPETLTAYEMGLKSRFLENKLQVNSSLYYWDYQNHQEPVLTYTNVPGVTNLEFLNAGASRIAGGTLDAEALLWTGGTLSASVEYANSKYKTFTKTIPTFAYNPASTGCRVAAQTPANTTLDCSGFEVSRTPQWSGGTGFSQEVGLPTGKLIGRATVSFATSRYLGTDFIPIEHVNGYAKLDLSTTYRPTANNWSITGFVRNVNNAAVYTEAAKNPFSSLVYADIQPPRTYGARISFDLH
jgi:iron complex outermembrane receptor protein